MQLTAGFKKYFANTSWLIAERVFRIIVGLFVGIYVARYLGPEQFGLLSYANSFITLFMALALLGLDGIVVRELVKTPELRDELLGTAFRLKIIGTLLMWAIVAIAINFTNNSSDINIIIAIIACGAIFQSFNVIDFNYQALVKSKYVVRVQFVQLCLSSIIKLVLIAVKAPLLYFAWVYFFDAIVLAIGLVVIYRKTGNQIFCWHWNWSIGKDLLKDSWPLMLSGFAIMGQAKVDQIMLGNMLGMKSVAGYSIAIQLIASFDFIAVAICQSLAPRITKSKNENQSIYLNDLLLIYRLMFILFLLAVTMIVLFGESVVLFLYGIEYQLAASLVAYCSIRLFFTNYGVAKSLFIRNEGLFYYALIASVIGLLVNVLLNLYFIPLYAEKGAIIATLISFLVSQFLVDIFYRKTRINLKLMLVSLLTPWRFYGLTGKT